MNKYLFTFFSIFSLSTMYPTKWLEYVNYQSEDGKTALHNLISEVKEYDKFCAIFEVIFQEGCNLNTQDKAGLTPLHQAILEGNDGKDSIAIIQQLLREGAHPNIPDFKGNFPLHYACKKGHQNTILVLKLNGADLHQVNKNHQSSFDLVPSYNKTFQQHYNLNNNNNQTTKGAFPQS